MTYMWHLVQSMQRYYEGTMKTYTVLVTNDISDGKAYTYGIGIYYKWPMGNFSSLVASAWYQKEHPKPQQNMFVSADRNNN